MLLGLLKFLIATTANARSLWSLATLNGRHALSSRFDLTCLVAVAAVGTEPDHAKACALGAYNGRGWCIGDRHCDQTVEAVTSI